MLFALEKNANDNLECHFFLLQMAYTWKLFAWSLFCVFPVVVYSTNLKQEYFTDAVFTCNHTLHNFTSDFSINKTYWIIPNGTVISQAYSGSHVEVDSDFTITIHRIDDDDFGNYYCLLVRSDYSVDRIKHGLNVDGPYFGDLVAIYSRRAMIGGIAGGSLFLVLMGCCLVWHFRYQQREDRNKAVDDLDRAIDGYDLKAYHNVGMEPDEDSVTKVEARTSGINAGVVNGESIIVTVEDKF